jgi:hypothetical protein
MLPHVKMDIPQSGVAEAYGILAHLTTGNDHPVARYINGLKTARYRPQHAPSNAIEVTRHAVIVGLVRAIEAMTGVPRSEAVRLAITAAESVDIELKETQVRNWVNRLNGNTSVEGFANHFLREAAPDREKILALGATDISVWWSVPKLPTAKAFVPKPLFDEQPSCRTLCQRST